MVLAVAENKCAETVVMRQKLLRQPEDYVFASGLVKFMLEILLGK